MSYGEFFESLKSLAEKVERIDSPVKIVGHLDSDGIAAMSIIVKAFMRTNIKFSVSILRQISGNALDELSREDYQYFVFVDLGANCVKLISEKLKDREIFILDHHLAENFASKNVVHVNPFLFGIDGDEEISGSGVAYFFAKELNEANKDMSHIAIIGAIGDVQENNGFKGLNKEILKDAVDSGKMEVKEGLSIFGMQTKPIHKILVHNTDPYIPGVTGSDGGAVSFLNELGIEIKKKGKFRRIVDLDEEEMKKLVTGIILKRMGSEKNPEDIMGNIYLLKNEEDESPTKDAKEFSTLLNSCGRLGKFSLGIGTCIGDKNLKKKAVELMDEYKKEIVNALNWFYENKREGNIIERKGYVIINAEDNVKDTLIGTLASIISRSNIYTNETIIVSMAHTLDGNTKVSMRTSGGERFDLRMIIKEIVEKVGGEGGGHRNAGGCFIEQEKEEDFLEVVKEVLEKHVLEEVVK